GTTDYQDNYWWGFLMTGPAALAATDDTASGVLSGSNRPAFHQALAFSKWNAILPYFSASGGRWSEGTGYGVYDTWFAGRFADAFLTAGQPLDNPWFTRAIEWTLHTTMPGGVFKAPLGDQSRVSTAPLFVYDREALLSLLPSAKLDATLTGEVQAFLNLIGQIPATEVGVPSVLTDELLRFDPAATVGAVGTLPNGYVDQNDGVVLYRQNWTDPNATMLVFRSGPMAESHSGLDAN